jgi:hypothetical protein
MIDTLPCEILAIIVSHFQISTFRSFLRVCRKFNQLRHKKILPIQTRIDEDQYVMYYCNGEYFTFQNTLYDGRRCFWYEEYGKIEEYKHDTDTITLITYRVKTPFIVLYDTQGRKKTSSNMGYKRLPDALIKFFVRDEFVVPRLF